VGRQEGRKTKRKQSLTGMCSLACGPSTGIDA
jgi:hypothetical protein